MSARDKLYAYAGTPSVLPESMLDAALDAHRAEVLAEGAAELDRIADETEARVAAYYGQASGIGPGSAELVREAARTLRSLAGEPSARTEGKSSQPADATPDFFQPGRPYRSRQHADLRFECLALSADPDTSDQQAIGWRYGPPHNGIRRHKLAALGAEDWACCGWTEITDTTTTGEDGAL